MKWFKHFSDAHDSNDLTKVRMRYGADGYAIYWYCLELISNDLGKNENITFELKHDAEVIGFNLKIDTLRVEEIMRYMISLNLFEQVNSTITCLKLAKYLDKRTTRNETIHKIIDASIIGLSETKASVSETNRDKVRRCTLDTDTDTDIKLSNDNLSDNPKMVSIPEKNNRKIKFTCPEDWRPAKSTYDLAARHGITSIFVDQHVTEFIFYWRERGDKRAGWELTFLNFIKTQWQKFGTQNAKNYKLDQPKLTPLERVRLANGSTSLDEIRRSREPTGRIFEAEFENYDSTH